MYSIFIKGIIKGYCYDPTILNAKHKSMIVTLDIFK
jgi:hypothetical protein